MATKFKCVGAKWEIEGGTPGTFAEVPQVMSLDVPQASADEIEVTTLDNVTGFREFLPSFKDGGEMGFTLVFDPAQHVGTGKVWDLFVSGDVVNMRIYLPTTAPGFNYTFPGFIKSCGPGPIGPDEAITLEGSVRISGSCDFVAVAP